MEGFHASDSHQHIQGSHAVHASQGRGSSETPPSAVCKPDAVDELQPQQRQEKRLNTKHLQPQHIQQPSLHTQISPQLPQQHQERRQLPNLSHRPTGPPPHGVAPPVPIATPQSYTGEMDGDTTKNKGGAVALLQSSLAPLAIQIHLPPPLYIPPVEDGQQQQLPLQHGASCSPRSHYNSQQPPPPPPPAPPVTVYYNNSDDRQRGTKSSKSKTKEAITEKELGTFPWEKFDLKPKTIKVKDYVILRTLGSGTYGTVKTGQEVAVKVIKKTSLSEEDLARIQRELKIITMLSHPNIIKVYDVIDSKRVTYIVMEYCGGGDLRRHIKSQPKGRLAPSEALPLFRQILCGLSYCHQHLVIHRDIKPENILLTTDLTAKIGDFGFSRTFNLKTAMQTACGSLAYAAPEVIDATIRGYIGPKSDVWSMGCVLYEMLSGELPFFEQFEWETIREIKLGRYKDTNKIPKKLMVLIERMLTPDPSERASLREIQVHPFTWLDRPLMYAFVLPFCKAILEKRGNIYSANAEDFDIDMGEEEVEEREPSRKAEKRKEEDSQTETKTDTRDEKIDAEAEVAMPVQQDDTEHPKEQQTQLSFSTDDALVGQLGKALSEGDQRPVKSRHLRTKSHEPEQKTMQAPLRQQSFPKQQTQYEQNIKKPRSQKSAFDAEEQGSQALGKAKSVDRDEERVDDSGKEADGPDSSVTPRMRRSLSDPTRFQVSKTGKRRKKNSNPDVPPIISGANTVSRKNSMFSWIRSGGSPTSADEPTVPRLLLSDSGGTTTKGAPKAITPRSPPVSPRGTKSPPASPRKAASPPLSPLSPRKLSTTEQKERTNEKEEKRLRKEKERKEKEDERKERKKKVKEERKEKLRSEKKEKEERQREKRELQKKLKEEERSQKALKTSKRKETPRGEDRTNATQHHRRASSGDNQRDKTIEKPTIPTPPLPPPLVSMITSILEEETSPSPHDDSFTSSSSSSSTESAKTSLTMPRQQRKRDTRFRRSVSASALFADSPSRLLTRTNSFSSQAQPALKKAGRAKGQRAGSKGEKKLPKKLNFFSN